MLVRVRLVIIMTNTLSTATIACMVKWIRKRTTDPHEDQQQKKGKGKSDITGWGARLVKGVS